MPASSAYLSLSPGPSPITAQRAVAGRLLRHGLVERFGMHPADVQLERDGFGRPRLAGRPDVHFSVSHCPDAVAVLVADAPVGVDVEKIRPYDRYAARRVLADAELARLATSSEPDRDFFRLWTLKESYGKALGVGMSYPLREVRFEVRPDGMIASNRTDAGFQFEEGFTGLVIAVCRLRSTCPVDTTFKSLAWWPDADARG